MRCVAGEERGAAGGKGGKEFFCIFTRATFDIETSFFLVFYFLKKKKLLYRCFWATVLVKFTGVFFLKFIPNFMYFFKKFPVYDLKMGMQMGMDPSLAILVS